MDLTKKITDHLLNKESDRERGYIGASTIGNPCERAIWYEYKGFKQSKCPAILQITFDIGKRLEALLLDYIEDCGLKIIRANKDNNQLLFKDRQNPIFQGHADALMMLDDNPIIVEIKSAKASSFAKFAKLGLKEWSYQYYAQIQSYMGMAECFSAVIFVVNKDSSELKHEWVEFEPIIYEELQDTAKHIATLNEPPERLNKSPLYYICQRCKFREGCFQNDR